MAGTVKLQGKYLEIALKMLKDITTILEKNEVPYLLEAGTLLGIVRENRLLPWDTDMDLNVSSVNMKKLFSVRWKIWMAGYRSKIRICKKDSGPFKKGTPRILRIQTRKFLFFKGISMMDLFIKFPMDDSYYWTVDDKRPVLKSTPKHFYDNTTQLEFNGKMYPAPKEFKDYLTYYYGDWEVVHKDFNFRTGDTCDTVEL